MQTVFENAQALKKCMPAGKSFTLVGGCFDLLHVAHLYLLEYASKLEELLVVAVLSDLYLQSYKGPQRPIVPQAERLTMVAGLKVVDYVFLTNVSPSSSEVLSLLKPDSVVFEEDSGSGVRMQQRLVNIQLNSPRTKIHRLPRYWDREVSTSNIIRRIQKLDKIGGKSA